MTANPQILPKEPKEPKTKFALPAAIVLAAVLLILFWHPASADTPPSATPTLEKIVKTGHIKACYAVYPPSVIKDPNTGKLSGQMVDAFEHITDQANWTVDYVETTWGTFIGAMQAGQCDVFMANLFNKIERSKAVSFTQPMYYQANSALIRSNDNRFHTTADFNSPNVTIAVTQGTTTHYFAQKNFPLAKLDVIAGNDLTLVMADVSAGRADVALQDQYTIEGYAAAHPEVKDFVSLDPNEFIGVYPVTWAVRHDDQSLLTFFNNALDGLEAEGYFATLQAKYGTHWYVHPFELKRG